MRVRRISSRIGTMSLAAAGLRHGRGLRLCGPAAFSHFFTSAESHNEMLSDKGKVWGHLVPENEERGELCGRTLMSSRRLIDARGPRDRKGSLIGSVSELHHGKEGRPGDRPPLRQQGPGRDYRQCEQFRGAPAQAFGRLAGRWPMRVCKRRLRRRRRWFGRIGGDLTDAAGGGGVRPNWK